MTIPRLELRAALLASQILRTNSAILDVPMSSCHLWTDSQIILCWLRSDGPVGNDLVDNYIAQIQEVAAGATWHHVPTHCNPADIASRGADASKLISHSIWWNGLDWLAGDEENWPTDSVGVSPKDGVERSSALQCLVTQRVEDQPPTSHIEKFSSLDALLRATVRCRRLLQRRNSSSSARLPLAPVTADELRKGFLICVRLSQQQTFADELMLLRHRESLSRQSLLKSLEPFLDDEGIIRVGGRLGRSSLPYDERHPVLLSGQSHLALLVIRWTHERSLHGGFRTTYARVMQKAWITGGKTRVKRLIRLCLPCARIAARVAAQGMAPLPAVRVTPSRPFSKCGVDYAGPFSICRSVGRGLATYKGYVALFICLSTKAIHLELAGDLTTESFLGALTRFIGRRGRPVEIWSDNGTNFRGADLQLRRRLREAEIDWGLIEGKLAQEVITWKFIPPGAPHFGGLWEAGVKSMKAHLKRVTGSKRLTYEEFVTLLVSIEMILNNRPLTPPVGDLDDLDALTPSHFLIGSSSTSFPQPSSHELSITRDTHWELVKAMRDGFWVRWSREYLNTLLQKPKWRKPRPNLEVGEFVVIVDPSLLLGDGRCPMGKVIAVHPGKDGLVRTATV